MTQLQNYAVAYFQSVITRIASIVCTSMFYILYLQEIPHILIPNM